MRTVRVLILSILLLIASPVSAAVFWSDETGTEIDLPVGEDLYATGENVRIDTPAGGDIVAAGGTVSIAESVAGDVIVAGGDISISGEIKDDVRVAGGTVMISAPVRGDLFVFGGTVTLTRDAVIGGEVFIAGGNVVIEGTVNGLLRIRGGNVAFRGTAKGDADIRSGEMTLGGSIAGETILVADRITVAQAANFGESVRYWRSGPPLTFTEGQVEGTAELDRSLARPTMKGDDVRQILTAGFFAAQAYIILSAALFLFFLVLFGNRFFAEAGLVVKKAPGWSFLYGLLFFIVVPVVAILFFVSIIGIPIGLLLAGLYVFSLVFAKPIAAIVLTKALEGRTKKAKPWGKVKVFFAALGLYLGLKLLTFVPVLGWMVIFAAICIAFGALLTAKMREMRDW